VRGCRYGDGVRGTCRLVLDLSLLACKDVPAQSAGVRGQARVSFEAVFEDIGGCGESLLNRRRRRRSSIRRITKAKRIATTEPRPAATPIILVVAGVSVVCVVSRSDARLGDDEAGARRVVEDCDDEYVVVNILEDDLLVLRLHVTVAVLNVLGGAIRNAEEEVEGV
jgi:hypothetical protein